MYAIVWKLVQSFLGSRKAVAMIVWACARVLTPLGDRFGIPSDAIASVLEGLDKTVAPLLTWLAGQSLVDIAGEFKRARFNDKGQLIDKDGKVIEPPSLPEEAPSVDVLPVPPSEGMARG